MKNLKDMLTESLVEGVVTEGVTTYLVTDNIDGKTWKFGVYTKNNKEAVYLQNLSTKGGTRLFNIEVYDDSKDDIPGCGKSLSVKEFETELEKQK